MVDRYRPRLLFATTLLLCLGAAFLIGQHSYAQSADTKPESVTLRWFLRWSDTRIESIAVPLLERFHAEHPNIHIVVESASRSSDYYQQLRLQLTRGTPPDVFYPATHVAYDLALQGFLLPLTDLLRQDGVDLTAYDPSVLDLYDVGDQQLYCLPIDQAALAVAYNRTLFDNAGIPYPTAPWTWEDLLATAVALTADHDGDGTPEQYGIDRFYTYWPLLVWSATGHNVFDDPKFPTKFLLEEEDSVNAIQWLADLHLQHGVMPPPAGIDGVADPFRSGQAAMQIAGHWQVPTYLATPGLDFDFAPLPVDDYQVNRNDGSCFAIASTTRHPQAAWTFVQFLAGPKGLGAQMLTELQQITPALRNLQTSDAFRDPSLLPDHNLTAFLPSHTLTPAAANAARTSEQLTPASPVSEVQYNFPLYDPLHPIFQDWATVAESELQAVWSGKRSADDAVGRMANQAEDLLETLADEPVTRQSVEVTARRRATVPDRPTLPVTNTLAATESGAVGMGMHWPLAAATEISVTAPISERLQPALPFPRHFYVSPTGDDRHTGLRTTFPLATIQHALELVAPGDTIHLAPGSYFENVTSVTSGRANAPITIMGPPEAILHGNGDASAGFYLTHSYYTLAGFTMDGLHGDPTDPDGYTQKLLYVQGTGVKAGVTGLRVFNMTFRNAGGECLRLRYFAHHNEIAYSTFHICGLLDYEFDDGGKNGEAIYVGTAPDQWDDGKNPTADPDESSYNWIHHNTMDTQGNECTDIKEGSYGNVVEYNLCTGQLDPDSAGLGARGNHNIIRYNTIYGNIGAGVRLGGHEVDGVQYGTENEVYGNHLIGNRAGGIKIINEPQTRICGNRLERNIGKVVFGDGSEEYEPTVPC
ncbi:MAG: extracellular solute-binding protein [Caldilineaceae bacterium]|nr:extracellular solute-binding protein [Caldilineaceae bacterium]